MNKQKFHEKSPYLFVIVLEAILVIVAISASTITFMMELPEYAMYIITMVLLTLVTTLFLWKMNWWKRIGFLLLKKKHFLLLAIPCIPLLGNLLGSYELMSFNFYISYFLICALIGFVEEGLFRGLMLRVLLKKGVWKAVLISSFLFSLSHILNALAGMNWSNILLQLIYSFALGFGWSAFALRTNTIWPLMIIHALVNFFGFIKTDNIIKSVQSSQPDLQGIIYSIVLSVVFIIYGIIVTRSFVKASR